MIEDGLITPQFGDALHDVRTVGNLGAHATDERVDEETAERVMRFTVLILQNLFEVPAALALIKDEAGGEEPPPSASTS